MTTSSLTIAKRADRSLSAELRRAVKSHIRAERTEASDD